MALVLERVLPVSRRCVHVEGHGRAKAAVRRAAIRLRRMPFVMRTDVRGYYASIGPVKLVERLAHYVCEPDVLRLVAALTARTSERGGLFRDSGGLPLGCPLSPLLGGLLPPRGPAARSDRALLRAIHGRHSGAHADAVEATARVRVLNQTFDALGLEKHPDKTFIGRAERRFDFLGYHLAPGHLTLARATVVRFLERAHRLHEQERGKPEGFPQLGAYVRRWQGWARGGFGADMRPLPRAISRMSPCDQGGDTSQLSPVFVTTA